jgi:16S rRNA (guanine966-N2)-methyltransferase
MRAASVRPDAARMRIVAGEFRSRRLVAPAGADTRPTSDRAREALFAMLGDVAGDRALDLFAGSGALGLEALSRGAAFCTFVERDRAALAALRANVAELGVGDRSTVRAGDVRRALRADAAAGRQYDLLLIDPPYRMLRDVLPALDRLLGDLAPPGARLALEAAAADEPVVRGFQLDRRRRAGAASLSLFIRAEAPL